MTAARRRRVVCVTAHDVHAIRAFDVNALDYLLKLREWEVRPPGQCFARGHRTAIVNLDHVERVERSGDDAFAMFLRGIAAPVPMSRRHAARLRGLG